jgi:hypothetical protein
VAGLTRALITRHAAGRRDAYDAALLDVAQDHLLYLLAQLEVFSADELVFKGGTSLRKCRLGNDGRFSTDLDFAAPSDDVVLQVCAAVDGAAVGGFHYALRSTRGDGRHWDLTVTHDQLNFPQPPRTAGPRAAGRIARSDGTTERVHTKWETEPPYAIPG